MTLCRVSLVVVLGFFAFPALAQVTVSQPLDGGTVVNPIRFTASVKSSHPVTYMRIYVDHAAVWGGSVSQLDTFLTLPLGQRLVVVQAWDSKGSVQKTELRIQVQAPSGVVVSSPADLATVSSPVRIVASAAGATAMGVYVDHTLAHTTSNSVMDASIPMAAGDRYVVVQAWVNGSVVKTPLRLKVTSGIPSTARRYEDIDQMTGWESCDKCSGPGGDGSTTPHWMAQFQTTPSLDHASIDFFLGGTTPYASALWWKQLGAWDAATNFVYDISFFYRDHSAVQALEFDVNQSVNGRKHIFGTECNVKESGTWRVWNADPNVAKRGEWHNTGIPCKLAASQWHSLRWEFQRLPDSRVKYVAVTLNGVRHEVNRIYNSEPSGVRELNVAFQMDGNGSMTDYHVWVDKVRLTAW